MGEIRQNAGFTITKSVKVADIEYVFGEKITENDEEYVSWVCRYGNLYTIGMYSTNKTQALITYYQRIISELQNEIEILKEIENGKIWRIKKIS